MISRVFSVHDQKAVAFLPPFFFGTVGQAVRAISDCVTDPNHSFGNHPEDYTLFEVGSWDDSTGVLTPLDEPKVVVTLLVLKSEIENAKS